MTNSDLTLLGATTSIQVWHDAGTQWLYVRWRGSHEHAAVGEGWAWLLQCLQRHPCAKVLNDARYAATGWAGQEQWVGESLFPQLAQRGVRFVACVYPKALMARLSLDMTLSSTNEPCITAFEDLESAYAWQQQQQAPPESAHTAQA